jgi:hypothetical protein
MITLRYTCKQVERAVERITGIKNASAGTEDQAENCFRLIAQVALNRDDLPFSVDANTHPMRLYDKLSDEDEWEFTISPYTYKPVTTAEFVDFVKEIQSLIIER